MMGYSAVLRRPANPVHTGGILNAPSSCVRFDIRIYFGPCRESCACNKVASLASWSSTHREERWVMEYMGPKLKLKNPSRSNK